MDTAAAARPRILLGTAQLTTAYGVTNRRASLPEAADSLKLLDAASRAGIDTVDTAPVYGNAEEVIGHSSAALRVHTKAETGMLPSRSLARSRERLGNHSVDVLYLHDPTEVLRGDGPVLADARSASEGGSTALGASVYEVEEFDAAVRDRTIGFVQVPLNVLDRRFTGARLDDAIASETRVVARSALLQGVLAAPSTELLAPVQHLQRFVSPIAMIAREADRTPLELAVAWVCGLPGIHGVVLGCTNTIELDQLLCAASRALPSGVRAQLDALELPSPEACDPRRWTAS